MPNPMSSVKPVAIRTEDFLKAKVKPVTECHSDCHGSDTEPFCVRTQSPYCALTNPNMIKRAD